ncbi:teicoplanin resistance protein VanZ [Oribacterium sp. C9]|uniref:VanZ family protein n=1 Tax=Oribacterium sp. C9 TaxID=1943579 RepID=UPI00098FB579|nr:VanZ family protein [Oribacterium sp. C9]OON87720.1 teicoplanin resistance protein VanZ [Oribacterium sp. C9]
MAKHRTRNQKIGWVLFVIYLLALFYLMFFSEMEQRGFGAKTEYTYNLTPLLEIKRYLFFSKQIGFRGVMLNLYGNIIGFMPFGFILGVISRRCRTHWYNAVICTYLLSYGIEMVQLITRAGSCDVDDIILNTLGGALGYLIFRYVLHKRTVRYVRFAEKRRGYRGY